MADQRPLKGMLISIVNIMGERFEPRPGAKADYDNVFEVFNKIFDFGERNAIYRENLCVSDFSHKLRVDYPDIESTPGNCRCVCCLLKTTDFSNVDCVVFHISSHGCEIDGETMISFVQGSLLPLSEIYLALSDSECPALQDKPRILIIQACRSAPNRGTVEQVYIITPEATTVSVACICLPQILHLLNHFIL